MSADLSHVPIERVWRSPNYNERPQGQSSIDAIVLHSCEGSSPAGTLSWICDTRSQVSYHYYIDRAGLIYEVVDPQHRAWHVSAHGWNDRAIGVSMHHKWRNVVGEYTAPQMHSLSELCRALIDRYQIAESKIVLHRWVQWWDRRDPTDWPDAEARPWIGYLYTLESPPTAMPAPGTYETVRGAVVRSGPSVSPTNAVMYPEPQSWLQIREWVRGELRGGSSWWGHLTSRQGFIHKSGVGERIGD